MLIVAGILFGFVASGYCCYRTWRRYSREGWLTKIALLTAIPVVGFPSVGMFASAFALEPDALQEALARVIAGLLLTAPFVAVALFVDRRIARYRASR